MIIPSIDIRGGRAVQLLGGEKMLLDGGDPLERLEEFSIAGEVAVIDLDAAQGVGSNESLITEMARRAKIRVGGGIRSTEAALKWLNSGVERIIIGTKATPEFCSALPRDRIIAAVDARAGQVVVDGWTRTTDDSAVERIKRLSPHVGGFLCTQVEHEGGMNGYDHTAVKAALQAVRQPVSADHMGSDFNSTPRVTLAGGITTVEEIRDLDRLGADAQVGMALYSGVISLGEAIAAPLKQPGENGLWPTVVVDESGGTLGLVWSSVSSIEAAVREHKGLYWSRSREQLWEKGATSGNTQELVRIDLDCDRDSILFTVRQKGNFCHTGSRSCFVTGFDVGELERKIRTQISARDPHSGSWKVASNPDLLAEKLIEEAKELGEASPEDIVHEAADLLYFLAVALARNEKSFDQVIRVLAARSRRITRRPMTSKIESRHQ